MQFYLMMLVITFLIIASVVHICNRMFDLNLYADLDNFVPAYIIVFVASVLWFIVWPVTIVGAVCYLVFKILDKLFLRKYLKKDKPDA